MNKFLKKFIKRFNSLKAIFRGFPNIYYRKSTEQYTFLLKFPEVYNYFFVGLFDETVACQKYIRQYFAQC